MVRTREEDSNDLQFQWGKKRGIGGAKKDVQFYEAFTYDDIDYTLYDCVYLYQNGEPEPHIGKIMKIWEQSDGRKKVKVLWFFHPSEIQNYLGDYTPLEKEIFLGSGEGVGLTNINPLEAIAGKCCVICTSKDERNSQPSSKDLEMADYIFSCTFNVGRCMISNKLEDKIAGIDVKFLLNRKMCENPLSTSKVDANGIGGHGKQDGSAGPSCNDSNSDSLKALEDKAINDNEPMHATSSISKDDVVKDKHPDEAKNVSKEKTIAKSLNDPINNVLDIVTRIPDVDRSRWFKGRPWEGQIQKADEQGTLVFVDNLDPSFTSADVQGIMLHACNQDCTAKLISQSTFQNTNYGLAYAIFKTREAADIAVQKINKGCLMQPNGRPLLCSKGLLKVPPKSSMLTGHLSIDKIKLQMQREEMKKAVSTSHCSQPNTIEYAMALEWMLIQEKSLNCYKQLHKAHGGEQRRVKEGLKWK